MNLDSCRTVVTGNPGSIYIRILLSSIVDPHLHLQVVEFHNTSIKHEEADETPANMISVMMKYLFLCLRY